MKKYEAYRDGDEPSLCLSAVLFLDLLGTVAPRTPAEAAMHLQATHAALKRARDWGDSDPADASAAVSWFSDNLGMAHPVTEHQPEDQALGQLISDAAAHQLALIQHGFAARGAVSLDLFYADPDFIYGPALNRAVLLEKSRAISPRVVLDEAAAQASRRHLIEVWGGGPQAPQRAQLATDGEGVTFVHYLADGLEFDEEQAPLSLAYLKTHQGFILARLAAFDGEPRIHDKYRWLAAYHDWFLDSFEGSPLETEARALMVRCTRPLDPGFQAFGRDVPVPPEDE